MWIPRKFDLKLLKQKLRHAPVVALLGPRQCGKTTLARKLKYQHFFDLENPLDIQKLKNPQLILEPLRGLIVIDEIQRKKELFPLLRYLVDRFQKKQKYLILGSASRALVMQSTESLAGRVSYFILEGFKIQDVKPKNWKKLWLRGGIPRSYLAQTDRQSYFWRQDYITSFLERDIPQLGIRIAARSLHQFWSLLAHYHGQVIQYSEIARAFGMSDMTVKHYLNILSDTFMILQLQPWKTSLKKRLVKNPKIYFHDTGLLHQLLTIQTMDHLWSHPKIGASWEGFVCNHLIRLFAPKRSAEFYFWATHSGAELDLFWQQHGKNFGAEIKFQDAPSFTKSMASAIENLHLQKLWVIYPGKDTYFLKKNVLVLPFSNIQKILKA